MSEGYHRGRFTNGASNCKRPGRCGSLWWNAESRRASRMRPRRIWKLCSPAANACGSGAESTARPCGQWSRRCEDDSPAGQRAGISVPEGLRHAQKRDRVKILYWDRDGFAIWSKRLEQGTYAVPLGDGEGNRREITPQELGAILSGIDVEQAKRRKRYHRAK